MVVAFVDPEEVTTVYVTIGNSDDGLTQREWAEFHAEVDMAINRRAEHVYGIWLSEPSSRYQNACWGFALKYGAFDVLREALAHWAAVFRQDSIAWVSGHTHLIEASQ